MMSAVTGDMYMQQVYVSQIMNPTEYMLEPDIHAHAHYGIQQCVVYALYKCFSFNC